MPGADAWAEAETVPWEPNLEWEKNQVCLYEGRFYQYLAGGEGSGKEGGTSDDDEHTVVPDGDRVITGDAVLTPAEDDAWGLIGDWTEDYEYDWSEGACDYVVADNAVFYPVFNPNAAKLEEGVNVIREDPRNPSVVAHMSRIALYHLHSIVSPTNVPETRRWAYEDSVQWLYNASKFRINPQIPRKREKDSCMPKVDWALATFQRGFDPNENPWLI